MKALVTGGAGFIGSHLVDRLIAEDHTVDVIDDLSTGRRSNLNPAARFIMGDAGLEFWGHPLDYTYDWIFHLAGKADLVLSIEQPLDYFTANVVPTAKLLEFARHGRVSKFLYAASSSCYGVNPPIPTPEDAPIYPAHPYALTKRLGEELVLHYRRVYGLPVVSLRLFNVYGPRARTTGAYGAVIGTFLAQKANGAPLTIVGNGEQRRDFVWVEDVVDAFIRAAKSDATGVFNIGCAEYPASINELARLIGGPVVHLPARGGEPYMTMAKISRARQHLGWMSTTTFATGIGRLLEDLDAFRSAPVWTPEAIEKVMGPWHAHLG